MSGMCILLSYVESWGMWEDQWTGKWEKQLKCLKTCKSSKQLRAIKGLSECLCIHMLMHTCMYESRSWIEAEGNMLCVCERSQSLICMPWGWSIFLHLAISVFWFRFSHHVFLRQPLDTDLLRIELRLVRLIHSRPFMTQQQTHTHTYTHTCWLFSLEVVEILLLYCYSAEYWLWILAL